MQKICIQAGHVNTQNGQTGAPGEQAFNLDVANQVSSELRKRGFEVYQTDANGDGDPKVTDQDFDLFLAIHYDADIYKASGGFVDFADPLKDIATKESQRIAQYIREEYFTTTGIENHPERSNPNTRFYYMWSVLSPKTPCVLIECGIGWRVPKDSDVLNSNKRTSLVVPGIVKGICKAFNIPFDLPVSNTPSHSASTNLQNPPKTDEINKYEQLVNKIKAILFGKGWPWQKILKLKDIISLF
jgi:N-acetylmuramoyl-L-alanine amidase